METKIHLPEYARLVAPKLKMYLENILGREVELNIDSDFGQSTINFYVKYYSIELSLNLRNREFQYIHELKYLRESFCLKLRAMIEKQRSGTSLRRHEEAFAIADR